MSTDAFNAFARRQNLPTNFLSADFEMVPAWLRERAFWMAGVNDAEVLQRFRNEIELMAQGRSSGTESMNRLHLYLERRGYRPPPGTDGAIQDLRTWRRMSVSLDTNVAIARGYGQWVTAQENLRAYPAWQLRRESPRQEPRPWGLLWHTAYQKTIGTPGALLEPQIALINHPIWKAIDGFHTGFPPFGYNSGMGVKSIGFIQARELGLMEDPSTRELWENPVIESPNHSLGFQPEITSDDLRQALADRMQGLGRWQGDTFVHTDPNGTRPISAEALADAWKQGLPEGFESQQKDAFLGWMNGILPFSPLVEMVMKRLTDSSASFMAILKETFL
jgi:hypothetical protein